MGATRWEAILAVIAADRARRHLRRDRARASVARSARRWRSPCWSATPTGSAWSLFSPANTLAALLANNFPKPSGDEVEALMYAALVLLAITLLVNIVGTLIMRGPRAAEGPELSMAGTRAARRRRASPSLDRSLQRSPRRSPSCVLTAAAWVVALLAARPAVLGAVHAARARRGAARAIALFTELPPAGVRAGRRLRQRHRRHAGDGRHRLGDQRAVRHPGRRVTWR